MGFISTIKRLGNKVSHGLSEAKRLGHKVTAAGARLGQKITNISKAAQKFTSPIATAASGIPVIGTVAGLADKAARGGEILGKGISAASEAGGKALATGEALARAGRGIMEAKSGADLVATARDMKRIGSQGIQEGKGALQDAKDVGKSLQRLKSSKP